MSKNVNRSPGSLRAQLPLRISLVAVLPLLTLGVALTLIVVPGVPVVSQSDVEVFASDDSPAEVVDQKKQREAIEGWIRDLSDDSWAIRRVARQKLIEKGPQALPDLQKALESSDPEVRDQAQSIIEELEQKKKQARPVTKPEDAKGVVERRVIRLGPTGAIEVEVQLGDSDSNDLDRNPAGNDPFEAIRDAERHMKKVEEDMARRFPRAFPGPSVFDPMDLFGPFDPFRGSSRGWSGSTRFQLTRDGQVVIDTSSASSVMALEPAGLVLESVPPSLRAHLPGLSEGGVLISQVRAGSYAESVGLKKWDVVVALGESQITSSDQLKELIIEMPENLKWHIVRGGKEATLETSK